MVREVKASSSTIELFLLDNISKSLNSVIVGNGETKLETSQRQGSLIPGDILQIKQNRVTRSVSSSYEESRLSIEVLVCFVQDDRVVWTKDIFKSSGEAFDTVNLAKINRSDANCKFTV